MNWRNRMDFNFINHWECLKDWLEFTFLAIIFDYKETEYKYLEITILNFEFIFNWKK